MIAYIGAILFEFNNGHHFLFYSFWGSFFGTVGSKKKKKCALVPRIELVYKVNQFFYNRQQ